MRSATRFIGTSILFTGLLAAPATTEANAITGIPVASLTSTSPVGIPNVTYDVLHDSTPDGRSNATDGWVKYFIPLEQSTSGTYGVNGVGMSADTGNGPGYLLMNLMFTPTAPTPLVDARLEFEFTDLDLRYVNDPAGFLETVRVYSKDGAYVEPISPQFTQATGSGSTGTYDGINWEVQRKSGTDGANWPILLNFWGDGLEAMMTDPFWVQLKFTVPSGVPYGKNTPEYVRATLKTESAVVVPEPASMLLLGSGLGAAILRRRRAGRTR